MANRRTPEHQRRVEELRRSSAAQPHRSARSYDRRDTSWRDEG